MDDETDDSDFTDVMDDMKGGCSAHGTIKSPADRASWTEDLRSESLFGDGAGNASGVWLQLPVLEFLIDNASRHLTWNPVVATALAQA